MTLETFPRDGVVDYKAFNAALESFKPGDAATIFTPGMTSTHIYTHIYSIIYYVFTTSSYT
jgi:hypothetical protein